MRLWRYTRTKHAILGLRQHRPNREPCARGSDGELIPAEPEALANQPGRNKNANRHPHQQQGANKERPLRWRAVVVPGVQTVVDAVRAPGDLPGTKVALSALFVQIREQQEDQQGNNPWEDYDTGHYPVVHAG